MKTKHSSNGMTLVEIFYFLGGGGLRAELIQRKKKRSKRKSGEAHSPPEWLSSRRAGPILQVS